MKKNKKMNLLASAASILLSTQAIADGDDDARAKKDHPYLKNGESTERDRLMSNQEYKKSTLQKKTSKAKDRKPASASDPIIDQEYQNSTLQDKDSDMKGRKPASRDLEIRDREYEESTLPSKNKNEDTMEEYDRET